MCQRSLSPSGNHPHAPICSDGCRREAMRRAGVSDASEPQAEAPASQFERFTATHLFCPTCRQSMPTRERLLLTLPGGDLYGYSCARCGTDVGTHTTTGAS